MLALIDASQDVRWLVLNAEAWTYLDSTAIDVLSELAEIAKEVEAELSKAKREADAEA